MKRTILASLALSIAAASGSAIAADEKQGLYFIADVGTSHTTGYDSFSEGVISADHDENTNMYSLGLGTEFGNNFFAEAAYASLGESEYDNMVFTPIPPAISDTGSLKTEHSAFTARIGKIFPWSNGISFTTHLGAAYVTAETSWSEEVFDGATTTTFGGKEKEDTMAALAGIGMNLSLTENLDARVRFERMINVDSVYDSYHLDNLTAGIAYHW